MQGIRAKFEKIVRHTDSFQFQNLCHDRRQRALIGSPRSDIFTVSNRRAQVRCGEFILVYFAVQG